MTPATLTRINKTSESGELDQEEVTGFYFFAPVVGHSFHFIFSCDDKFARERVTSPVGEIVSQEGEETIFKTCTGSTYKLANSFKTIEG